MTDGPARVELSGELRERAERSWRRLHEPCYAPTAVFKPMDYAWPGDTEGRILLAWAKLSRLLGRDSENAREMLSRWPAAVSAGGHFGPPLNPEAVDEQQLAGHGWVLRGLSEWQLLHPEADLRPLVERLFRGLLAPLAPLLAEYPVEDGARRAAGAVAGSADRRIGRWKVSTDVGAVFILFDGLVQAAGVFGLEAQPLLEGFLALARRFDARGVRAQAHAPLTLARGLLRYGDWTGCAEAVALARRAYALYRAEAMTANYANYNWFGRPEWTEPCAVVDSFLLALALPLHRRTRDDAFLEDAHRIWFSALEREQRPNGGFGGDSCVRPEEPELAMRFYEAVGCCTMRGAEGLGERGLGTIWREDGGLFLAVPAPGVFTFADGLQVRVETDYPVGERWRAEVLAPGRAPLTGIRAFMLPGGWRSETGGAAAFPLERRPCGPEAHTLWRGPVMQGEDASGRLRPVNELWRLPDDEARALKLCVVW